MIIFLFHFFILVLFIKKSVTHAYFFKMTINVIWYAETSNFPSSSVPKKYDENSNLAEFRYSPRRNVGTEADSISNLYLTLSVVLFVSRK